jgi:hypothetical protein
LNRNSFVWNSDSTTFATNKASVFIVNAPYGGPSMWGVGINTNDPRADLEVNGSILGSGNFRALWSIATSWTVQAGVVKLDPSAPLWVYSGGSCTEAGTIKYNGTNFLWCNGSIRKKLDN